MMLLFGIIILIIIIKHLIRSLYIPHPIINKGLKAYLEVQKLKGIGKVFPLLDFINANINERETKAKYTLVDFWFSACGPCIFYFNSLRDTYKEFHHKGFNIVAISIDRKKVHCPNTRGVIKKFQYTWDQVLDLNGVKTKSININKFPSTLSFGLVRERLFKLLSNQSC